MRYLALVTDYDGTLATHGKVSDATATAIQRLRNSGRHAILATGRRPEDVRTVCPYIDAFSQVVAENGALVFDPKQREGTLLGRATASQFLRMLRGVKYYSTRSRNSHRLYPYGQSSENTCTHSGLGKSGQRDKVCTA